MFNGFRKLDLDDSFSSSYFVVVDKNVEAVKWHNILGHIGKAKNE